MDRLRRRVLKGILLGAAAAPLSQIAGCGTGPGGDRTSSAPPRDAPPDGIPGPHPSPASAPAAPVVVAARREGTLLPDGSADPVRIADGLGAAVARAAGEERPLDAFRRLFRPDDVVGIKVNALAGAALSARPEVVGRICAWLREAGVPARQIVVMDRTERELRGVGLTPNRLGDGVRVIGTDGDFERRKRSWGPNASRFARILAEDITALINLGVLKDGGIAGAAIGMKNWYGVIDNPQTCHDDGCHPYIAHLAAFPLVRDRLRLTIADALVAQCHAGPYHNPRWTWPLESFLVSADPVALDAVGTRILEARRREVGLPSLAEEGRAPKWIAEGERLGLGVADPGRIEVVEA